MKTFYLAIVFLTMLMATSCTGNSNTNTNDTASATNAGDTMPVLKPGNVDSSSIIETPPTNDDNVIMPDSAIKSK